MVNANPASRDLHPLDSDPAPRKSQSRAINRRNAIATTAWRLISERGFDATSVNTIIAELGISKGSFYHHFESKAAVIDAVVEMLTTEVTERVAADNADGTALERLIAFIRSGWEWHEDHATVSLQISVVMLRPENTELLQRISATERRVFRPLLEDIIEQGRVDSLFDVPNAALAADLLMPMLSDALIRVSREVIAGTMAAPELIAQVQFLQHALEKVLGAPSGSLDGAIPTTAASRKQVQTFIDGFVAMAGKLTPPATGAK